MSLRHLLVVLSFTLVGCRAAAGPESPTPAPMDDDDAVDDDDAIDDDDDDEEDRTDEIFENEMIVIDIQMSNDDWEALRFQRKTRHSAFGSTNCREVQVPNPYTWFPAAVTGDGEEVEGVGRVPGACSWRARQAYRRANRRCGWGGGWGGRGPRAPAAPPGAPAPPSPPHDTGGRG